MIPESHDKSRFAARRAHEFDLMRAGRQHYGHDARRWLFRRKTLDGLTIDLDCQVAREAEVELAKGHSLAEVVRKLGITDQTYYRWRKEYGGLRTDQARRL